MNVQKTYNETFPSIKQIGMKCKQGPHDARYINTFKLILLTSIALRKYFFINLFRGIVFYYDLSDLI